MKGIVLAGGKSSRFGSDKALALIKGVPMIQRAVDLLTELRLDPCVIASALQDYSFLNCKIERDLIPEQGPLGGIHTAFCQSEESPLMVLTCDMPIVSREVLCTLIEAHSAENQVTVFKKERGSIQPFPGIYDSCLKVLTRKCIHEKLLSMQQFIQKIPKKKILRPHSDSNHFLNINFKSDLPVDKLPL